MPAAARPPGKAEVAGAGAAGTPLRSGGCLGPAPSVAVRACGAVAEVLAVRTRCRYGHAAPPTAANPPAIRGDAARPPTGAAGDHPAIRMDTRPETPPSGAAPASRPDSAHPDPARPDPSRPDPSRIERLCVERGLKMTGQRRVIARVLSDSSDHPDVEELYRRAVALDARISIATVYRTVRLLEEKGILERHDFGGSRARYEPTEHGHHHHLIDVDTGRVIEFSEPDHERLAQEIAARLGFDLVGHRLELFGRRRPDTAVASGTDPAAPDAPPRTEPRRGRGQGGAA
jgi:Fur family transcriptional regulator, ferric uptake regulator